MLDWSGPVEVECECGSVTFVSLLFLVLKLRGEFELFSLSSLRLCWEWKGVGHGREVGNEWVDALVESILVESIHTHAYDTLHPYKACARTRRTQHTARVRVRVRARVSTQYLAFFMQTFSFMLP